MHRVAKARREGNAAALVVRAAGCRASIEASEIDDVIYWDEGVQGTSVSHECVGFVPYEQDNLQLFPLHGHVSAPKWHLTCSRSHWVVVVRVHSQRVGLVVEGLLGWGDIVQFRSLRGADAKKIDLVSVRMDEEALEAELVEVGSIIKADTTGSYFYV